MINVSNNMNSIKGPFAQKILSFISAIKNFFNYFYFLYIKIKKNLFQKII